MSDGATASEGRFRTLPRSSGGLSALTARLSPDALTLAIVVLLAGTWLSEGTRTLLGLPHGVVGLVDVAEAAVCIWLALRLVREGRIQLLLVVCPYAAWVLSGLINTHAPPASVLTALKDLLLLPVLALLVASRGPSEQRAWAVAVTLFALCAFEFVLTLVQLGVVSGATTNPDLVVGSFGSSDNAVTGVVFLLAACVGISGYLVRARYGEIALVGAVGFPLFSAWALVKFETLIFPLVVAGIGVTALLLRQTNWRRAATATLAAVASSVVVVASYAAFHPQSFKTITSVGAFDNYLHTGTNSSASSRALLNGAVLANFGNASVIDSRAPVPGGIAFEITNRTRGGYGAWLVAPKGKTQEGWFDVRPGRQYAFAAGVVGAANFPQTVRPFITWVSPAGHSLSRVSGKSIALPGAGSAQRRVGVHGFPPRGAVYAYPAVEVIGAPPLGAAIYVSSPRFAQGHGVPLTPAGIPTGARASPSRPSTAPPNPAIGVAPGHLTLLRMAVDGISTGITPELFGHGAGSATVAADLGVRPQDLSPYAAAASFSDIGTGLFERGWAGLAFITVLAVVILIMAVGIARRRPGGCWGTAFSLSVPAATAVMVGYGLLGTQLQNRSAALTFWLIVALGLSSASVVRRSPRGRRQI